MEPADLRQGNGAALLGRFDGSRLRSILSEREVRYALRRCAFTPLGSAPAALGPFSATPGSQRSSMLSSKVMTRCR